MHYEPDHLLLRRYHVAMDRGDLEAAAEAWEQLTVNNFDRMSQIVKAFRFSPATNGLAADECGSAVSEAYIRVRSMGAHFRKREVGQYYAALVTCVQNTCRDFGRKELRHDKHAAGSVDKTFDPDGEAGPYDGALAAYDADLRQRSIDAVEDELDKQHVEQFVAWGISQIKNHNYQEVLELTYIQKISAEEIAEQLAISMDNVYARRSRGGRELEKILRDSQE
jgi:DNA-directed RNA polymerase specialized sigma24 family protein